MHTLLCSTHTDTHAYTHTPVHTLTYKYTHKCRPSIYIDTHMHTQTHTYPQLPQPPSLLDQAGVNLDLKSRKDFVYLSRLPPSPFLSRMVSKTLGHPQDLASFPSLTFPLLQNRLPHVPIHRTLSQQVSKAINGVPPSSGCGDALDIS